MKKILSLFVFFSLFVLVTGFAVAASPDGLGPWADIVVSSTQGLRKNGTAVLAARSNPTAALGVAEGNSIDTNFFALGFGGSATLGFDNGISSGVLVVEATNPNYPSETARVELSADGSTWIDAGNVSQDGTVNVPQGITCAKFARITDTSNPNNFVDDTADGYDLDGIQAIGDVCQPVASPSPTPPPQGTGGCSVIIGQSNVGSIANNIGLAAKTGKNKASKNTGGTTQIQTGIATALAKVQNLLNSNAVSVGNVCNNNVNISITGNGAGSQNSVNVSL